jgi:hypothetical protein
MISLLPIEQSPERDAELRAFLEGKKVTIPNGVSYEFWTPIKGKLRDDCLAQRLILTWMYPADGSERKLEKAPLEVGSDALAGVTLLTSFLSRLSPPNEPNHS